jgi:Serine/threonine protein kinase
MVDFPPAAQQAELEAHRSKVIGQMLFGSYTIIGIMSKNNGAIKYKAVEPSGRKVVVKVLVNPTQEIARVFVEASRALTGLEHRSVAATRAYLGASKDQTYSVRDFVAGVPLSEILESAGYLDQEEEIADILIQLCNVLEFAHCKGIVNGAIKPENIIFTEDGGDVIAKLTDFTQKIKRSTPDAKFDTITQPTDLTDILLLGALTHLLVTGQSAFAGRSLRDIAEGQALLNERNGSFATLRPELLCYTELDQLVDEALDPDPSWRVQTVSDFRDGVKNWLEAVRLAKMQPTKVLDKITDPNFIEQAKANHQPKKARTTIKSLVRLRAHQRSQEQTVIFRIADTVAAKGKGPRLSPAQTAIRLAGVALVTGVLASTAVVVCKNHPDELRQTWLWTSQKLSSLLPSSVRTSDRDQSELATQIATPGNQPGAPRMHSASTAQATARAAEIQHFNPEHIHYYYRGELPPGELNNSTARAGSNRFRIEYKEFNRDWLK